MHDWFLWVLLLVGALAAVTPAPVALAPTLLRRFGRSAWIEFVADADGRLASGRPVEQVLSRVIWRLTRAWGCFFAPAALTIMLMTSGPPLSRSEVKSVVAALVVCTMVVGPYLVLREFLAPVAGEPDGSVRRAVVVDDYLGPVRRVVAWLAAGSALVIALGAALLATTSVYDGSKIYWEGLVGLPVATIGVVLAAGLEMRGTRDSMSDPALTYLWDALRARTLRSTALVATVGAALAWQMASQGLVGVALDASDVPGWVSTAHGISSVLFAVFLICALVSALMTWFPSVRFRRRLWPDLAPGEKVRWGGVPVPGPTS